MRILHVVSHMDPIAGGAETWLMEVYRRTDRERFRFDFLVHTPERLRFHDEVERLGGRLLRADRPVKLWKYGPAFRRLAAEHGPYEACHVHIPYCGYALRLARTAGIPHRIAHSHNDRGVTSAGVPLPVRAFVGWTNRWVRREATVGLACSGRADDAMFGPGWAADPRWRRLDYGIDLSAFARPLDPAAVRASLGLPADAPVVGHVGRFGAQKNHEFLVRVFAEVARRDPRAWLLLVGDGDLRGAVERQVAAAGLTDRVRFAGLRPDVPDLMRGAMDVFVLPSLFEGLPLVGLEAQAAGLPVVLSDTITDELDVVPQVRRLPLTSPPADWADALLGILRRPRPDPATALAAVGRRFGIEASVAALSAFYEELAGRSATKRFDR